MTCHRLALVVCLAAAAGCFDPRPRVGLLCGPQGECPQGQICSFDGRCQIGGPDGPPDAPAGMPGDPIDAPAGTHDASIDAPPDAAPVGCQRDADCTSQNTCGSFGSCQDGNPQDLCDSGSRSRTCMDFTCQLSTGTCVGSARTETVECNGNTDGRACGVDGQQLSCTSCNYNDVCDTEASQTCTFVREQCQNDACVRQPNEVRNLTCSRPGPANPLDACGPPTTSGCGECLNPSNMCSATGGQQECTVTHHGCVSGACGSIPGGTVSQSCTPGNQNGRVCGQCGAGEIGDWICTGGQCVSQCHCFQDGEGRPLC
jgi:hypothetical protein